VAGRTDTQGDRAGMMAVRGRFVTRQLELDGAVYELVCVRRSGVAVFRGPGRFLRLGDELPVEVETHRRMLELGYPVADILDVGEHDGVPYLVERSMDEPTLGDAWADRDDDSWVSAEEFAGFLAIMVRQAQAQLRDIRPPGRAELAGFLDVGTACANVPALAGEIEEAFSLAWVSLQDFPAALQHGDLHPFNVCPLGIIDLEGSGWASAGYDVTTAVLEPTLARAVWDHDRLTLTWFTPDQVATYLEAIDRVFREASLPPPSASLDAYLVCRVVATCSRIPRDPGTWRSRTQTLERSLASFLENAGFPITLGRETGAGR
jgi:hypothetical protein